MDIDPTAWVEPTASIDRTWPRGIHIGARAYIADDVIVLTHDFTRGVYLDTRIGADCHIGARSILLPGVTLGDGCHVRPGSLVAKDVPASATVAGNPAVIQDQDAADADGARRAE
jgi:acetyltransferase-like isoleucine patch superfamily enzyme